MNFFKPFINTRLVVFMVAGKDSYDVPIIVISQADVTSVQWQIVYMWSMTGTENMLVRNQEEGWWQVSEEHLGLEGI